MSLVAMRWRGPDAGWLYLISGVIICAAGILIPARVDLDSMSDNVLRLHDQAQQRSARLREHSRFLDSLEAGDPDLVRRLAATQLNMMPAGDVPVLVEIGSSAAVADWIDARVSAQLVAHAAGPRDRRASLLERLATGPYRLWLFGGGVFAVFLGLMMTPDLAVRECPPAPARRGGVQRPHRRRRRLPPIADRGQLLFRWVVAPARLRDRIETIGDASGERTPIDTACSLFELPRDAVGVAQETLDEPADEVVGVLQETADEPADEVGVLQEALDEPADEVGVLQEILDEPTDGVGVPEESPDEPADGVGVPSDASDESDGDEYEYVYIDEDEPLPDGYEYADDGDDEYEYEYEYEYVDEADGGDEDAAPASDRAG